MKSVLLRIESIYDEDITDDVVLRIRETLDIMGYDGSVVEEPPDPNTIVVDACPYDDGAHDWILQQANPGRDRVYYKAICTGCGQVRALGDGA